MFKKRKNGKKMVTRPTKFTPLTVKKLEEAFSLDCSIPEACLLAGITKATYFNWKKENPQLFDRFELLRNNPILLARRTVTKAVSNNDEIAFRYLERKRRSEFGPRNTFSGEIFTGEIDKKHADIADKFLGQIKKGKKTTRKFDVK